MKMIGSTQWPVVCVTSSQEEGAIHSLMAVIYKHPYVHCGTWMESGPLTVTLILHTADVKESTPSCQELVMPQSPVAMMEDEDYDGTVATQFGKLGNTEQELQVLLSTCCSPESTVNDLPHTCAVHGVSHSPCYRLMSRWGGVCLMLYHSVNHLPEGIAINTWIVRPAIPSPVGTPSPQVQLESKVLSPPTQPATPSSDLPPPSQRVHQVQQVSHSPGRRTPPPLVPQPVPIPGSMAPPQQLGGRYPVTTSPPLSVCSPPDSTVDDFPPNVNPFVTHGTRNVDRYSPDRHSVIQGTDPADLVNNHQAQQSYIPSPPYTPYPSPTKHPPFDHTTPAPYASYPTPYSSGHPSPVRTIRQSLSPSETSADGQFGSPPPHTSPPYSSTAASSPYQEEIYITSEATQFTSPCGDGMQTALPIMESLLNPTTLGYQTTNSTDMRFMNSQATGSYVPATGQPSVPPRPTVIDGSYVDEARRRYNKVASGLPMGHTNQLRNDREGSESISQWSQWLKGGAPAPVY